MSMDVGFHSFLESVLPIETVISTGIIPYIVEGVKSNAAKIQLECVWILNNLATGNEEQVLFLGGI